MVDTSDYRTPLLSDHHKETGMSLTDYIIVVSSWPKGQKDRVSVFEVCGVVRAMTLRCLLVFCFVMHGFKFSSNSLKFSFSCLNFLVADTSCWASD